MQDTAIEPVSATEDTGQPESPPDESPALAFSDALGAAQWMKSLPLSSVVPAYDALLAQLQALTASEIGPRDRATIAELAREPVAHLHTELARRYAGKPQPLDEREAEAADQAVALWQALWEPVLGLPASRCSRASTELQGRQGQAAAARAVRRQAADRRARHWRAAFPPPTCGRSCTRITGSPRCSTARWHRGVRRSDAGRGRAVVLFDVQPRIAAGARRSVRADRAADRAHRSLARPVGAQGISVREAARERRPGRSSSISKAGMARCSPARRPPRKAPRCASVIPAKLVDQRARTFEAPRERCDAGRAATGRRRVERGVQRRC